MSQKQAQSETKYRLLVLILKNIIEEGHITEEKIKSICKAISKKYKLVIGWLGADEWERRLLKKQQNQNQKAAHR